MPFTDNANISLSSNLLFMTGPNREQVLIQVKHGNIDVLLASYHTLAADLKKFQQEKEDFVNAKRHAQKKRKKSGPSIFEIKFHRIVLDEGLWLIQSLFARRMKLQMKQLTILSLISHLKRISYEGPWLLQPFYLQRETSG